VFTMGTQMLVEEPADTIVNREVPDQRQVPSPTAFPEAFVPKQPGVTSGALAPARSAEASALPERDRAVLLFEKQYWKYPGAKEQAIRESFGISASSYYQILNGLLDRPEAQEFEPVTVNRLRRDRELRRRARSGHAADAATRR
jgi:hypothetical protein